ncbi:MAG: AzlD domain-containing protein [Anaerolineae bacterium]|nr:AzlD domain-containing protein [Anaerolineae bacterium]
MEDWLIILGMVAVTYSARLSVIALLGQRPLPELIARALRYVPPAALAAIVFPALLLPDGALDISPGNLRLLAGLAAALIAWRTHRTLLAIGAGMVALWLLQAALP